MMDLEKFLTGENLAFYKNIQYLKELTVNAKAVINRSYAKYEDILQKHELKKEVRALESLEVDRKSVSSLAECGKCRLNHGAEGFCIVEEIIKSEAAHKQGEREREKATTQPAPKSGGIEGQEPQKKQHAPTINKAQWEDLLLRDMSPAELEEEYSNICLLHGMKSGKNFLLARALSKGPSSTEPFFTSTRGKDVTKNQKLFPIVNSCIPERGDFPSEKPCPEFSGKVLERMSTLLKNSSVCDFSAWKDPKIWRKALGGDRMARGSQEAERVDSIMSSLPEHIWSSKACVCGNIECDCDSHTTCPLPKKNCPLANNDHNNYVRTIRNKLKRRREDNLRQFQSSSPFNQKADGNVLRRDSEMLLQKAKGTFRDDLKACLTPVVDVSTEQEKNQFDQNISKLAEMPSQFSRPDERSWDLWVARLQEQEELDDDAGISGNSDIQISESGTESTDYEFAENKPPVMRIPFSGETMKLVNVVFGKIEAKFAKTLKKNYLDHMIHPFKRHFYSRAHEFMVLKGTESIAADVSEKLHCYILSLKTLQPSKVRKSRKLKRLNANRKLLSRTAKRRNFNLGIQVGLTYRRVRHSANFKEEKGYVGFKPEERELLRKPIPERFTMTGLFKGDSDELWFSKKRIHRQYRLLRTLFDGTSQNVKESLMDEGMKARLESFRKSLPKPSEIEPGTSSEDEPASVRRPSKRDEMKLKSAQEDRSRQVSRKMSVHTGHTRKRTGFGKSHATRTQSNTQTFSRSHETITEPRPLLKSSHTPMSKDFSYRQFHSHLESFHLPTPPHSDSSDEESLDSEIQNRVPRKEEAHMEQSALKRVTVDDHDGSDTQVRFHGRLDYSELTDKSSDSYVPKLLSLADRTAKSPMSLRRYAHRGLAYQKTKGRILSPYQSESSSDSDPGQAPRRVRSAWDHKPRRKNITRNETQKDSECSTSPKNIAAKSLLPKPGASILKKTSLPIPPSGSTETNINTNSGVTAAKYQAWSGSGYRSTSYPSESLIRPAHVVTERLLKAPQDILPGPSKKFSRTTPERDPRSTLPSKPGGTSAQESRTASADARSSNKSGSLVGQARLKRPEDQVIKIPSKQIEHSSQQVGTTRGQASQELSKQSKQTEAQPKEDPTLLSSSAQNKQSQLGRHSKQQDDEVQSNQSITVNEPDGLRSGSATHRLGGSVSRSDRSSRKPESRGERRKSRAMSDLFNKWSNLSPTIQSERIEQKEPMTRNKSGKKSVMDGGMPRAESSAQSLVSAVWRIAPTDKRVFNVDIGQGINVVNFLKEKSPGADSKRQKDLVDLLVTPVEVKKTPMKPIKSIEESSEDRVAVASIGQTVRRPRSVVDKRSNKAHSITVTDDMQSQSFNFKTLDQIYKDVHGINAHNTPAKLVEDEYEYESKKKQQLKRHKILP